jgi:hypothetical protein
MKLETTWASGLAAWALLIAGCSTGGDEAGAVDAASAPDAAVADGAGAVPDAPAAGEPDAPPADAAVDAGVDATPPDAAPAVDVAIVLTGAAVTATAGHVYTGSEMAVDECPAGHVLTGLRGRLRAAYNGPVQGVCRELGLLAGPLAVTTGATIELPPHGAVLAGDTVWSRDCPDGQMIVGVDGRAGAIIDRLVFRCAPLAVTAAAPYVVSVGAVTTLEPVGGIGGAVFTPTVCAAGQVGRGLSTYFNGDPGFGLDRVYLDGIALVCATPEVVPVP